MENLIQKHYKNLTSNDCYDIEIYSNTDTISEFNYKKAASKSAEITKDIAIKFYEWADTSEKAYKFWRRNKVDPDMSGKHNKLIQEKRKILFEEFLKTLKE